MAKNHIKHKIIAAKIVDGSLSRLKTAYIKEPIKWFVGAIKRALVRGCDIRDVAVILEVSIEKRIELRPVDMP